MLTSSLAVTKSSSQLSFLCPRYVLKVNEFLANLQAEASRINIEQACRLYDPPIDQYEMIWEKSLDTKCLLAWNRQHIILAFRGTASLSNVKADLQVTNSSLTTPQIASHSSINFHVLCETFKLSQSIVWGESFALHHPS